MLDAQPNVNAIELEVLRFWREQKIYQESEKARIGSKPFVIYDGPPTANAKPALHHMIPGSYKDLVGRYQTMRGRYVPRQAGWDTHGLPVEVQVERALGLSGKKDILNLVPGDEAASIKKFNAVCRDSVWEFKQDWDRFLEREGYWLDTVNPYVTYSPEYVEAVWATLKRVWNKDLVYKGYKVVPYCPRCGTSLSASELALEYQDVRDVSVFVSFKLLEQPNRSLLAWTTTPWTLPGNTALAVNPTLQYVAVRQGEQEYVLAKSRLAVLQGDYEILEEFSGQSLVGLRYQPPFAGALSVEGEKFVVIGAAFVTESDGSGIVHTAPMYGEDDFAAGKEYGLAMQHTVGLDGHFFPEVPVVGGQYIRDALGVILTHLKEHGILYAKQGFTHSYPHCWRCKTALLYYAKDSWFIAMSGIRKELVESNSSVDWIPDHLKDGRFGGFIKEARDWAISRERFWGTPLPIWKSEAGAYLCVGSFAELKSLAEDPTLIGTSFDPHRPQVDEITLIKDGVRYTREPLVLDVWFDSGSMPYASGRVAAKQFPADYIAEAVDQTRGWFYTLMALGTILEAQSPYRTVVCMGHLVDESGKKMSKSLGNGFDPFLMMEEVGADALRWFFYTVNSPGETKSFSQADVRTGFRKTLLLTYNLVKYWQTYALSATEVGELQLLDYWAIAREAEAVTGITTALDAYDFMRAGRTLEEYIGDLSTWYLRRSRKRQDAAFFTVFYERLIVLLRLLAPFTPFMSEYLYRQIRTDNDLISVHLLNWPAVTDADQEVLTVMRDLRRLVELGQGIRAEEKLKVRQPLAQAWICGVSSLSLEAAEIVADELNVGQVTLVDSLPGDMPTRTQGGLSIALDPRLDDALIEAGQAREVTRQLQALRKSLGLKPGEFVTLVTGPFARANLEPLFIKFPEVLKDACITIDPAVTWEIAGETPLLVGGETVYVTLRLG